MASASSSSFRTCRPSPGRSSERSGAARSSRWATRSLRRRRSSTSSATRARPRSSPCRAVAEVLRPVIEAEGSEVQVMFVVPDAATGSDPEARIAGTSLLGEGEGARRPRSMPRLPMEPVKIASRRAGDLALHERLHRRAEGERPHAARLRVQHRGLREADGRLSPGRRHDQRAASVLRLRDGDEPDVPVRRRRHRGPLQRASHARERSRTRSRCTGPRS